MEEIDIGNCWVPAVYPLRISDDLKVNIESSNKENWGIIEKILSTCQIFDDDDY